MFRWRNVQAAAWVLVGLLVIGGCGAGAPRRGPVALRPAEVAPQTEVVTPEGERIAVPPPALWPEAATKTRAWAQWSEIGNLTKLRHVDAEGRVYVADMLGVVRAADDPTATLYGEMMGVSRYRADGTLEVATMMGGGSPSRWTWYAEDGATPTVRVSQSVGNGRPRVSVVEVFDSPSRSRVYQVTEQGQALATTP